MKKQWILIANASMARLLRRGTAIGPLIPLETMTHEQSRQKAGDLADDRPGTDNSRDANRFEAKSIGGVGIFPCADGRDEAAAVRLSEAMETVLREAPRPPIMPDIPIQALYRGDPPAEAADRVWFAGPGFWLERKSPQ